MIPADFLVPVQTHNPIAGGVHHEVRFIFFVFPSIARCPKTLCPVFSQCRGGALHSIINFLTQLHKVGFDLKFETLL